MKKFVNDPVMFVDEMLEGILEAHPDQLSHCADNKRNIVRVPRADKVGLVTGGGSGHLPLFMGYVGEGLLDGCAVGGVFQSPSADQIYEITKHVDAGKGVLYICSKTPATTAATTSSRCGPTPGACGGC